jgi:branched-chain amino acid transport system substrate-binding protein
MMQDKISLFWKMVVVVVALSLLIPILAACGNNDDKEVQTPTATATSSYVNTPTPMSTTVTPTPTTSTEPIKIGAITPWSGPAAVAGTYYADPSIKLVENQVKQMGGILGGRLIKVVKYDNRAVVAEASAGAVKLVTDDKVSALVFGGTGGAECSAVADVADQLKVLYVANATVDNLVERKFSLEATFPWSACVDDVVNAVIKLKPKSVGYLVQDDSQFQRLIPLWTSKIEAAGIKTVYSERINLDVQDISPYLTKIKYANPDVLVLMVDNGQCVSTAKQIGELGGLGDTKVLGFPMALFAARQPAAKGWLVLTFWHPAMENTASQKFKDEFQALIGRQPDLNTVYYYFCLWTAIDAIKLAGTDDTVAIGQAARSGNLVVDSPMGLAHFSTGGENDLHLTLVEIEEVGKTVIVK